MAPTATHHSGTIPSGALTPDQLDKFRAEGYLILSDFFDSREILNHARSLIQNFDPSQHPLTKFTTGDNTKKEDAHVGDRYFLESGDKIRYFLEEDSIDVKSGKLNRSPELCVNKCGHALHVLDPTFYQLSFSQRVQNLVKSLESFQDPRILQSMVICKQPSIGGAVPSHNDSTFLFTNPPSAIGLWFALEDCTRSNGCLSFLPCSHRWSKEGSTPLPPSSSSSSSSSCPRPANDAVDIVKQYGTPRGVNKRFVRTKPGHVGSGTSFEVLSTQEEDQWDESRAVVEECKAGEYSIIQPLASNLVSHFLNYTFSLFTGTLVLIHGSVLHKSEKNLSEKSRYIYTFHCIEGQAEYDDKNWLQPTPEMSFSKLYNPPERPPISSTA